MDSKSLRREEYDEAIPECQEHGGKQMTTLTKHVEFALAEIELADQRWRLGKIEAESRARTAANLEIAERSAERDRKVRLAFDAGAPKLRIGRALGTKDPYTINKILERTEAVDSGGSGADVAAAETLASAADSLSELSVNL